MKNVSNCKPTPAAFHNEISNICSQRNDEWGKTVYTRISGGFDMENGDIAFHKQYEINFRINKSIPLLKKNPLKSFPAPKRERSSGVMPDKERSDAFLVAMKYLENHNEEYVTIGEIQKIMSDEGVEPYNSKWMRNRILNYFENDRDVMITRATKINDHIVTFKHRTATLILEDFYKLTTKQQELSEDEKEKNIIEAAANLLKQKTMLLLPNKEEFTLSNDLSSAEKLLDFVPETLQTFLEILFVGKLKSKKIATLGHLIVQNIRPRSIAAPLSLSIGIMLHHLTGRRDIVDLLHQLGLCCSYTDVLNYEKSETISKRNDLKGYTPASFVQHVADNADHNSCTLDGKGTFHGMAIIAAITPCSKNTFRSVPWRTDITANEIRNATSINIVPYCGDEKVSLYPLMLTL